MHISHPLREVKERDVQTLAHCPKVDEVHNLLLFFHIVFRHSPDFLALPDEFIEDITYNRTWVEWKVLRQYLELYNEALNVAEEICYHITMNTRIIAQVCGIDGGDIFTLDLCLKYFNTYLRSGINSRSARGVYNCLFQYRLLGEYCIEKAALLRQRNKGTEKDSEQLKEASALEDRVIRIGKYLRYYSYISLPVLEFWVAVIAQEIRNLCETAIKVQSKVHDQLLDVFLSIYDRSELGKDKAIEGVRIAQVCLATAYMVLNRKQYAQRIKEDLQSDSPGIHDNTFC